jgi:hypothetical protein
MFSFPPLFEQLFILTVMELYQQQQHRLLTVYYVYNYCIRCETI